MGQNNQNLTYSSQYKDYEMEWLANPSPEDKHMMKS